MKVLVMFKHGDTYERNNHFDELVLASYEFLF